MIAPSHPLLLSSALLLAGLVVPTPGWAQDTRDEPRPGAATEVQQLCGGGTGLACDGAAGRSLQILPEGETRPGGLGLDQVPADRGQPADADDTRVERFLTDRALERDAADRERRRLETFTVIGDPDPVERPLEAGQPGQTRSLSTETLGEAMIGGGPSAREIDAFITVDEGAGGLEFRAIAIGQAPLGSRFELQLLTDGPGGRSSSSQRGAIVLDSNDPRTLATTRLRVAPDTEWTANLRVFAPDGSLATARVLTSGSAVQP